MSYLADTNVLLRWAQVQSPLHSLALTAVDAIRRSGEMLFITPQNLVEFWNTATRPVAANGFGLTPSQADSEIQGLEQIFPLVPDIPVIHQQWRLLVVAVAVQGRQVHDARLVAVMKAHGITHLLTFNDADFRRYPGITAVHPAGITAAP